MATEAEKKAIRSAAAKKAAETRRRNKIAAEEKRKQQEQEQEQKNNSRNCWLPWGLVGLALLLALLLWHPWTKTTKEPVVETEVPIVETEAPVVATEAPVITTEAPVVATEASTESIIIETVLSCPNTTEEAKNLFGIDVQRIDTEPCAWVWRGKPLHTTATCPSGYVCTWDVVGDITVVHLGINQQADIYAGTWRLISAYPADDAVNNVCELYLKEKDFASREVPSFEVRFQPVPDLGPQTCP